LDKRNLVLRKKISLEIRRLRLKPYACACLCARGAHSGALCSVAGAAAPPVSHRRNHTPALLLVSHLYSTTCSTAWTRPRMHIRSRPAPGTGDESRDRAELRCTRSSRSRTGEAHRTRTAQVQAGHTAAAQRSARNEARPCIYLRRSGGSRAVRSYTPAPAAPAWDATQAQCSHHAARTNPALASVSGASRRSRAAPGRRSLIVAAIASAAVAIAVTPPLGTVLVAHAELAGTASPSASPLLPSQSASHPAAAMVAAERKKKSTPPALAGEAPASQLKSYSQPLPQRMGTTEKRPSADGQLQRPTHPIPRSTRCAQGMEERGAARRMSGERAPTMEMASLNTLRIILGPSPRGLAGSV